MNYNELKKNTLSGVVWRFGERAIAQVISLVVSLILARILSPDEYGTIAIITIFITIANVFADSGLGTSLVQHQNTNEDDFSTMLYASMAFSIITYIILFIIAPIISIKYKKNITLLIRIMGIKIPLAGINSIQQAYVQKKMIYKKFFFSTLIGTVISGVVGIFLAFNNFGVWALVCQYLTNTVIDVLVLSVTIGWKPRLHFEIERFLVFFDFGWKIMATSLIGTIFSQLKGLIIGYKYSSSELAYYNKGDQFPAIIYNNTAITIESVFFSALAKVQSDNEQFEKSFLKMISMSSFILFPLLMGLAGTGDTLINILLTNKWASCVPFLRLFCLDYCITLIGVLNIQGIKSMGRSDLLLKLEFVKKPIYFAFLLIGLIWGPIGIAVSNCIYDVVGSTINVLLNMRISNNSILKQLKCLCPQAFAALSMAYVVYCLGRIGINIYARLFLQIIGGIIYYTIVSYIICREQVQLFLGLRKMIKNG